MSQASSPLSVSQPHHTWSEQDPEDWWQAVNRAVLSLDADLRRRVRAIGLAGQMHGATLLDRTDKVLRPAILWNDGRSHAECRELEAAVPASRKITGNIAMPGFTAPKLSWVRKHERDIFRSTATVLLPKDYVRLRLSGDKASDMSDSAGTLWMDVARRTWSDEMLSATGLASAHMPKLFEGSEATGSLRSVTASDWGMDQVPIAAGAGDNAAGAVGVGVINRGDAVLSLGTSGVIFVADSAFRPNPDDAVHTFCHCIPERWHQMSVHLSAASCIDWAATQLGLAGPSDVIALAEKTGPAAGQELFLPFLSGERTPHNNPHLRAGFLGLDHATTPESLSAAVLEGVAFAHADGLHALERAGSSIRRLSVIGGGSRSLHWGRILATILNKELDYLDGSAVGPALGAARLARLAVTQESPALVCRPPKIIDTIMPVPAWSEPLARKLENYRRAVSAMLTL